MLVLPAAVQVEAASLELVLHGGTLLALGRDAKQASAARIKQKATRRRPWNKRNKKTLSATMTDSSVAWISMLIDLAGQFLGIDAILAPLRQQRDFWPWALF